MTCGPRLEQIRWLPHRQRLTVTMINWVESLVRLLPVQHVAQLLGLHWHTVKAIDHQRLKREVVEPDRSPIRRLVMDEFALFKGHRYATVVINADNRQVLWVGEGNSREAIRPFFEWLGPETCTRIEAVAMDMNSAMDLEVGHHCPQAGCQSRRAAVSQSATDDRIPDEVPAQTAVVRQERAGCPMALDALVQPGNEQRHRCLDALCEKPEALCRGHYCQCHLSTTYQRTGGNK